MKREDVEKAAKKEIEDTISYAIRCEEIDNEESNYEAGRRDALYDFGKDLFTAGAGWRINCVWHNSKTEVPDVNTIVLVEKEDGSIWQYKVFAKSKMLGWKRWAYIKDLIPNE